MVDTSDPNIRLEVISDTGWPRLALVAGGDREICSITLSRLADALKPYFFGLTPVEDYSLYVGRRVRSRGRHEGTLVEAYSWESRKYPVMVEWDGSLPVDLEGTTHQGMTTHTSSGRVNIAREDRLDIIGLLPEGT